MLIALYDNKTYIVNNYDNKYVLITDQQDKADDGFTHDGNFYTKQIVLSDPKLISLYNLKLKADYNTNLPQVPVIWNVEFGQDTIKNSKLKLIFWHGILPGWFGDDKTISHQYIDFNDIGQCYAEYTYYKKNGQLFSDGPMHMFAKISVDELAQIVDYINGI